MDRKLQENVNKLLDEFFEKEEGIEAVLRDPKTIFNIIGGKLEELASEHKGLEDQVQLIKEYVLSQILLRGQREAIERVRKGGDISFLIAPW